MELETLIQGKLNYWVAITLVMIGLSAMIGKRNLVKKVMGMTIFQSAIIMFFVSMAVKAGSTIPILEHDLIHPPHHEEHAAHGSTDHDATAHSDATHDATAHGDAAHGAAHSKSADHDKAHPNPQIAPEDYANPLPHVLMLTAIVVGVATLGMALAVCLKIYQGYGTLEEPEIAEHIRRESLQEANAGAKNNPASGKEGSHHA